MSIIRVFIKQHNHQQVLERIPKVFLILVPKVELVLQSEVGRQIAQTSTLREQSSKAKTWFFCKKE